MSLIRGSGPGGGDDKKKRGPETISVNASEHKDKRWAGSPPAGDNDQNDGAFGDGFDLLQGGGDFEESQGGDYEFGGDEAGDVGDYENEEDGDEEVGEEEGEDEDEEEYDEFFDEKDSEDDSEEGLDEDEEKGEDDDKKDKKKEEEEKEDESGKNKIKLSDYEVKDAEEFLKWKDEDWTLDLEGIEGWWINSQQDYIEVKGNSARFDALGQSYVLTDKPTMICMGKWQLLKKQVSQLNLLWFHEINGKNIEWQRVPGKPKNSKPTVEVKGAGTAGANGTYVIEGQRDNAAKFIKHVPKSEREEDGIVRYELVRSNDKNEKKFWWIFSVDDEDKEEYLYQIASYNLIPPTVGWRRINEGKSPTPKLELSKLARKLRDMNYRRKWVTYKSSFTTTKKRNDGLPTKPRPIVADKDDKTNGYGLVEISVRPEDLRLEIKNYAQYRTVKKKSVLKVKHLKFRGKAANLRVEAKDMLVAINGRRVEEFEDKDGVLKYLSTLKDMKSVVIRLVKVKMMDSRMIDEDTLEAKVDLTDLQQRLGFTWAYDIKNNTPTMSTTSPVLFVERGDQIIKIVSKNGEDDYFFDTTAIEDREQIKDIVNNIVDDKVVIHIRKEEARQQKLRRKKLENEEELFRLWKKYKEGEGPEDTGETKLKIVEHFDKFDHLQGKKNKAGQPLAKKVRIYWSSFLNIMDDTQIYIGFMEAPWAEEGISYPMRHVPDTVIPSTPCRVAFFEFWCPIPEDKDEEEKKRENLFDFFFKIRMGSQHITTRLRRSFSKTRQSYHFRPELDFERIKKILGMMSLKSLAEPSVESLLRLLTHEEREKAKGFTYARKSTKPKEFIAFNHFVRIIGVHLAIDTREIPLDLGCQYAQGCHLYKKQLSDRVVQQIVQPIVQRMTQRRSSLEDLKILMFFHLVFELDFVPAVCFSFVKNAIRLMDPGTGLVGVFKYWENECKSYCARWRERTVELVRNDYHKNYVDGQQMALYTNFVHACMVQSEDFGETTKWSSVASAFKTKIANYFTYLEIEPLVKNLKLEILPLDLLLHPYCGAFGRPIPSEFIHLERYLETTKAEKGRNQLGGSQYSYHRSQQKSSAGWDDGDDEAGFFSAFDIGRGNRGGAGGDKGKGNTSKGGVRNVWSTETVGAPNFYNSAPAYTDDWSNFSVVCKDYVFTTGGVITSWKFESRGTSGVTVQVYRGDYSTWTLVGQNIISETFVDPELVVEVPTNQQIRVQAGDVIGLRMHSTSVIPFRGSSTIHSNWGNSGNHSAIRLGESYEFTYGGGREYLVQATVSSGRNFGGGNKKSNRSNMASSGKKTGGYKFKNYKKSTVPARPKNAKPKQKLEAFRDILIYLDSSLKMYGEGEGFTDELKHQVRERYVVYFKGEIGNFLSKFFHEHLELADWMSERGLKAPIIETLTYNLANEVKNMTHPLALENFVRLTHKYTELLIAAVRNGLMANEALDPKAVINTVFKGGLDPDFQRGVIYSAKVLFLKILLDPKRGPTYLFPIWVGLDNIDEKDMMVKSATQALEAHCKVLRGYDVVTKYLDNDHVHKLDKSILEIINNRMSEIEDLSLTEDEQNVLTNIVQNRLKNAEQDKIDLWNKVLSQVLPVKEKSQSQKLKDYCTEQKNLVFMCHDLISNTEAGSLPSQVDLFFNTFRKCFEQIADNVVQKKVNMGILNEIHTYLDEFNELTKLISSFTEYAHDALAERLKEYHELVHYQTLLNVIFPRYVPNTNMEMFSQDIQCLARFHRNKFGNWDTIVSESILSHPSLQLVKNIEPYMEHIQKNQAYIIFSGIWKQKLSSAMNSFEFNLNKQFSQEFGGQLIQRFHKCKNELGLIEVDAWGEHLLALNPERPEYVVTFEADEDLNLEIDSNKYVTIKNKENPSKLRSFGTHTILAIDKKTDIGTMGREDLIKYLEEHERPFAIKFNQTLTEEEEIRQKEGRKKYKEELLEETKEYWDKGSDLNALGYMTINDFLQYHMDQGDEFLKTVPNRLGFSATLRHKIFPKIDRITVSDATQSAVNGYYELNRESEKYLNLDDNTMEIQKNEEGFWQIVQNKSKDKIKVIYVCSLDTFIPPKNRGFWKAATGDRGDLPPRVSVAFHNGAEPQKLCLQTIFRNVYRDTNIEIDRLNSEIAMDRLSIDDLMTFFNDLNNADIPNIQNELKIFEAATESEVTKEIYDTFKLKREVRFLQDLCRVVECFSEFTNIPPLDLDAMEADKQAQIADLEQRGEEVVEEELVIEEVRVERIPPTKDGKFASVNDAVEGKRDLKKLGSTVKETSSVYVKIANQLGDIEFNDLQKQWVSHVSDNKKLIQSMAEEDHLNDDVEFGNLLEILDANQSSSLEAQRSVSLRKVRTILRKKFLLENFDDFMSIIVALSKVPISNTHFDDIVTVSECLEQLARTYKEASGDSLERDIRLLTSTMEFGCFELANPSLTSGLEIAELARRTMTLRVDSDLIDEMNQRMQTGFQRTVSIAGGPKSPNATSMRKTTANLFAVASHKNLLATEDKKAGDEDFGDGDDDSADFFDDSDDFNSPSFGAQKPRARVVSFMDDFNLGDSSVKKEKSVKTPSFNRYKTSPNLVQGDQNLTLTVRQNDLDVDFTKNGFRLEIAEVHSGGYADRIGLMKGDIIDSIDGVFQRDIRNTIGVLESKKTPYKLTVVRPDIFDRNRKKKNSTLDVLMQRYPHLDKEKVLKILVKKMKKVTARSGADKYLTNTIMRNQTTNAAEFAQRLMRPDFFNENVDDDDEYVREDETKDKEKDAKTKETLTYEGTQSLLDRLLMSILRKDEENRNNTMKLEQKFSIIEKISGCRCQFFMLGGRTGLVESRRIFLPTPMEELEDMLELWESKVANFQANISSSRDRYIWLNYYTVNELLALASSLNENMVKPYASLRIESSLHILEGTYKLQHERLVHGRPLYKQEIEIIKAKKDEEKPNDGEENANMKVDEDHSLFLWYNFMDGAWCISDEDHIDTTEVYCTTLCRVDDPIKIPASNVWLVYDEGEKGHIKGKVEIHKGETDPYDDPLKLTRLLHHLQYAKYTASMKDIKENLQDWQIVAEEQEQLLPRLGAWLGNVLGRKVTRAMFRAIPSITTEITGVEDGKPNLYLSEESEALSTIAAIFVQRNWCPISPQVLICTNYTTPEEIDILIQRCFHAAKNKLIFGEDDDYAPLFCLAFPENLNSECTSQVLLTMSKYLLSDEALKRNKRDGLLYCFAIVSCSRDSKLTQRFLQYERDHTKLDPVDASALYKQITCHDEESYKQGRYTGGDVPETRPFVKVYSSENIGAGKSYLIQSWAEQQNATLIRVPINSVNVQTKFIIKRLLSNITAERRVVHFDISSCAGTDVNELLFKIILLQHVSASGVRYNVCSRDALLVEVPTTITVSGDDIEAWSQEQVSKIDITNVDSRFWFVSKDGGLDRKEVAIETNPYDLTDREQFVLKYLRAYDKKVKVSRGGLRGTDDHEADLDFEPDEHPDLNNEEAKVIMDKFCEDGQNSRILQKCFINFMHSQLEQVHANVFFMNFCSPSPGYYHMREMVLDCVTQMARDFSSRLYFQELGEYEESSADSKFPLSVRWRESNVPMILMNQLDVNDDETDGDISMFARNLAAMEHNTAKNFFSLAEEMNYELVNFEEEEQRRKDQLSESGVVRDKISGKIKKLDLLLRVTGAPEENIRKQRIEHINKIHYRYALTFDNMLKMIAIYSRVKCGIPVLLMGETGCGKTKLMEYLSDVLCIDLFKCDVHGGFTAPYIIEFMQGPINKAKQNPDVMIWVFLDEVNTSPEVGLFKEIICDHSLNGVPLPENLTVLGALNPVRRRKFVEGKEKRKDMAGVETNMNNLVYRVFPLPETMKEYIWNFGALDELDESQYIGEMLKAAFPSNLDGSTGVVADHYFKYDKICGRIKGGQPSLMNRIVCCRIIFQKCAKACQQFTRDINGGEVSVVSLRDVSRVIFCFKWFMKHFDDDRHKSLLKPEAFYFKLIESMVLSLAHCYYYRLGESRKDFAAIMDKLINEPIELMEEKKKRTKEEIMADPKLREENMLGGSGFSSGGVPTIQKLPKVNKFEKILQQEQERYVRLMNIPKGVAKNRSLKENLFMILVCVMTKLPIVLVGKPGSSKTLSMNIVRENLNGSTKNPKLTALGFEDVYVVPFQCSKLSTAAVIKDRWEFGCSYQEADSKVRVLMWFDEVGLAEQSPYRPLKVFHQLLEHPKVSFVGLSNWALDSAKMNRAILHNCPVHNYEDLLDTARAIVESSTENKSLQDMLVRSLRIIAMIYSKVLHIQNESDKIVPDFYGARDFYACVQLITARIKLQKQESSKLQIDKELFYESIVRSFGGLSPEDLNDLLAQAMNESDGKLFPLEQTREQLVKWNGILAVDKNLEQTKSTTDTDIVGAQARHILVLTASETSWSVLFDANILKPEDTVVIFGSEFKADIGSTVNLYHTINRVRNCIEAGVTVILINVSDLHDALYDMLNQRYTRIGQRLYCRIAMGAESVICQVHPHFKCIVVGGKTNAHTGLIPVAFLNRFEKQVIDRRQLMSEHYQRLEMVFTEHMRQIGIFGTHLVDLPHFFCGYMEETIASLISVLHWYYNINHEEDVDFPEEEFIPLARRILLENTYAELFIDRYEDQSEFDMDEAKKLGLPFTDLVTGVTSKIDDHKKKHPDEDMRLIVRTHDRIFAADYMENCFRDNKYCDLKVKVVQLDEFETEAGFKQALEDFETQNDFDTLVVQSNHKGANLPHILHAQHIMEMRDTKQISRDDVEENKIVLEGEEEEGDKKAVATIVEEKDVGGGHLSEDEASEHVEPVDEKEENFVRTPKYWILLVHTHRLKQDAPLVDEHGKKRKRAFPLVFDRIWKSIYVDSLVPAADLGIPGLSELSSQTIPDVVRDDTARILRRVFRKSLAQLRFAQPVNMKEQISDMQGLLGTADGVPPWDKGKFLRVIQRRLLGLLDTDEFKKKISHVVLNRIKGEDEKHWIRGSFRDRLVNFVDKVMQVCFASQLKLLYEHGNFDLYDESHILKIREEQGPYCADEFADVWINTLNEWKIVVTTKIALTDKPQPVHVPHQYTSNFPFSFTLENWASTKRHDIEQIRQGGNQNDIAQALYETMKSSQWKMSYADLSKFTIQEFIKDMISAHMKYIYTESVDNPERTQIVKNLVTSFVMQSAFENRFDPPEEEVDEEIKEEEEDDFKDLNDEDPQGEKEKELTPEEMEALLEMKKAMKSLVSIWDVFPAFWYNTNNIANVLRLYLVSKADVQEKIMKVWRGDASDDKDRLIVWRVAKCLEHCLESLADILAHVEDKKQKKSITERIVACKFAMDQIIEWISSNPKMDEEWVEKTQLNWSKLQLKLMLARHIETDAEGRKKLFDAIDMSFQSTEMFDTADGFKAVVEHSVKESEESEEVSRVMRQYLEAFVFPLQKPEESVLEMILDLIDPMAKERSVLNGTTIELTGVCRVQFAQYLLKLLDHLTLGETVTDWIDERLSSHEFIDNELATLFLLVKEQEISDEIVIRNENGQKPIWKDGFVFRDRKPDIQWIHDVAICKAFLAHYANHLIKTNPNAAIATVESFGGESQLSFLFEDIISPDNVEVQFLHYFFIKMLFKGGIPWIQDLVGNEDIKEAFTNKISMLAGAKDVEEVNPYTVVGEKFTTMKEELDKIISCENEDLETLPAITLNAEEKNILPCILALHESVYTKNWAEKYYPMTMNTETPHDPIKKWMESDQVRPVLANLPEKEFIRSLAYNSFSELSRMYYTPEKTTIVNAYDKWDRYITGISFHLMAQLAVNPDNQLKQLLNKPEDFLDGYIPSMPLDAVESLGAMVGAAAFVCPKGHVYYVGDCTRPWLEAKCHCGETINAGDVASGADRIQYKNENRKADPGYLLIGTGTEVTEMKAFRRMDVLTTKIMRLLVHCILLLNNANSRQLKQAAHDEKVRKAEQIREKQRIERERKIEEEKKKAEEEKKRKEEEERQKRIAEEEKRRKEEEERKAKEEAESKEKALDYEEPEEKKTEEKTEEVTETTTEEKVEEKTTEEVKEAAEEKIEEKVEEVKEAAEEKVEEVVEEKVEEVKEVAEEKVEEVVEEKVEEVKEVVEEKVEEVVEEKVEEVKEVAEEKVEEVVEEKVEEVKEAAEEKVEVEVAEEKVEEKIEEVKEAAEEKVEEAKEVAEEKVEEKAEEVRVVAEEKVEEVKEVAEEKVEEVEKKEEEKVEEEHKVEEKVEEKKEEEKKEEEKKEEEKKEEEKKEEEVDPYANLTEEEKLKLMKEEEEKEEAARLEAERKAEEEEKEKLEAEKKAHTLEEYKEASPVEKLCQGHGKKEELQDFLHSQIIEYMQQIQKILGMDMEETNLFLHKTLAHFGTTFEQNYPNGIPDISTEAREEFEGYFTNQVVAALLPAEQTVNTLRKENLKENELLKKIWEDENLESEEGKVFRKNCLPNLMLEPQVVDYAGFSMSFCTDNKNKIEFPSLHAISIARPSIWVIRHLPAIHGWCKLLQNRYNRKISREDSKDRYSIGYVLDEMEKNNWGNRSNWLQEWNKVKACWNEIYDLINMKNQNRLDELKNDCVHIYRFITKFKEDPNKVKSVYLCPDEQDEGKIINSIVDHLVEVHNKFLKDSGLLKKIDPAEYNAMTEEEKEKIREEMDGSVAPVMNSDRCARSNLVDLDKRNVNKLIQSHSVRKLAYGAKEKLRYDLKGLEEDVKDNYVLGKGEIRSMLPRFEFSGAAKIENLFDGLKIDFVSLDLTFLSEITTFQSGIERGRALDLLEDVIIYVGRLGVGQADQPIYQFCRDLLSMEKSDYDLFNIANKGNELQLRHMRHLWEYLKKQVVFEDPKRRGAPDNVIEIYREEATDDLHEILEKFIDDIPKGEIEGLVTAWYDLLKLVGEVEYNADFYWNDIFSCFYTRELVLEKMPKLNMTQISAAYEFLANKFFELQNIGKEDDEEVEV